MKILLLEVFPARHQMHHLNFFLRVKVKSLTFTCRS